MPSLDICTSEAGTQKGPHCPLSAEPFASALSPPSHCLASATALPFQCICLLPAAAASTVVPSAGGAGNLELGTVEKALAPAGAPALAADAPAPAAAAAAATMPAPAAGLGSSSAGSRAAISTFATTSSSSRVPLISKLFLLPASVPAGGEGGQREVQQAVKIESGGSLVFAPAVPGHPRDPLTQLVLDFRCALALHLSQVDYGIWIHPSQGQQVVADDSSAEGQGARCKERR